MLNNERNREETGKQYRKPIPKLVERVRRAHANEAQEVHKEVARLISEPWVEMVDRKQSTQRMHWNANLQMRWEELRRKRRKARKSSLEVEKWQLRRNAKSSNEQTGGKGGSLKGGWTNY